MEDEGPTPLDQLTAYKKIVRIKVRVCRIWRPKYPGMGDKYTGLHCILVDEKQQAIEASSTEMDYEIIVPKIEAGTCYEIMNFRTNYARAQYRVVPHETQIIFTSKTVFKKLASVFPPIPRHRFFLQDYNKLYHRLNKCDILTDVIGHLISVQPLEPIQINQRIEDKCDLVIQNIRNEEAKITLWSDVAHAFSAFSLEQLDQPIIIVFTSLKVKLFGDSIILNNTGSTLFFIDPDIPELNTYKSVFSTWPHPIKTLPPSKQANEQDIFRTGKKMTIEELGYLDPDLYKNDTFLCKASIKRYNTKYEWWYTACPTCAKQMHQDPTSGQLICQKHPSQIPTPWYKVFLVLEDKTDEISALIIGRSGEKVFGVPCKDLVFNQRSVDQKQLPISSTAVSSSSTPVDIITDSPVDIITDSHKRKRELIRRALFVPSKTSEAEEICEIDAQDQDQVPIKLFKRKSSPTSSKADFAPYKKN
ncbi:replication protein A 70 kDa DNA-binding subunit C-like isoform X1 [Pyrus x bretschneideri]|uniref:replication protein A 70 kDa DNA-binding subunit C-like isoform X1 n=1 Tax=Pyrus x bretschneideri TaxID=225117 RepID=UPI00202E14C9|nr:replication protein A 70 kDa DNA-binding subunit C-like isoform X1 [Pyrus x bretschneideri]XP_048437622.1 replication protein A 70 kDa DNA-binding subunit C-like isoform X1 [Pyrus x bretschneideri]